MQVPHLQSGEEHHLGLAHQEELQGNFHWMNQAMKSDSVGGGAETVHQELGPGCHSLQLESHESWLSYSTQGRSLQFCLLM